MRPRVVRGQPCSTVTIRDPGRDDGHYCDDMAAPKPPTQAMLAAIGRVTSESAVVDDKLRDLLAVLISSPYGQAIAAGEDTSRLVDMCLRVARYNEHLSDENVEQLIGISKSINKLIPFRNFLVHARWEKLSAPGAHYGLRSRRVPTSSSGGEGYEGYLWDVNDALGVATAYSEVSQLIDEYITVGLKRDPYPTLLTRHMNDKIRQSWNDLLGDPDSPFSM